MYTVSILASPARADLDDDTISSLQRRWDGGRAIWLDRGTAAEFAIEARPTDFDEAWAQLDAQGFDLAVQPTAGRRKAVLLADMDSTMIGQECIDELADMAGVGQRVAAITARAMNGELDFHEAEYDPLRDEGEAYGRRLAEAGVPATVRRYEGAGHGFVQHFSWLPEFHGVFAETAAFLRGRG